MRSMTAYSEAQEKTKNTKTKIILRSLNYKYLDISVYNLPQQLLVLEEKIKEQIKRSITRGKVEVYFYQSSKSKERFSINKEKFSNYVKQIKSLAKQFDLEKKLSPLEILNLPGVVSGGKKGNISKTQLSSAVKKSLNKLISFKKEKGKVIEKEIAKNLSLLESNITKIGKTKRRPSKETDGKEDIDEELSLIGFYSQKVKKIIAKKKQIRKGKAIDFLTQEILRELNAASSKTRQKKIATLIVEAKNYLGRIREQAQNIE
ncbi:MAG: DUF1732 domain-containing protein [Candidatus Omnitrophica bacterium]|nr:DUF1732 domain-containing protein [Candidatus Omnitrophota bacterium]MCF7893713.1 DUF1732 domain-containing protein [Candidatus Omnitrophota bacterium]